MREWNRLAGLALKMLRGERNLSQQVLEIAMLGYETQSAADDALQAALEQMISPQVNRALTEFPLFGSSLDSIDRNRCSERTLV